MLAWERAWRTEDTVLTPSLPSDSEHFLITFLPGEWRTVSREGIALYSLRYRSPDLVPHIFGGCKQMVRFNPRDMSRFWKRGPNTSWPSSRMDRRYPSPCGA